MDKNVDRISGLITQMRELIDKENLSTEGKVDFDKLLKNLAREDKRWQFRMARTLKDKTIIINLLNKTIEDLQEHQLLLEHSNEQLSLQKKEIEHQKGILEEQNELVEHQAKELEMRLSELKMSYSDLERFSYIASHDLRAPLRTIISYAEILQRRYIRELDGDAQTFMHYLVSAAQEMNTLITALLEYSRTGRRKGAFVRVNLEHTLEHVKYSLRKEMEDKNATIEADQLPILEAEKSSMFKLFLHLLKNALYYSNSEQPRLCVICKEEELHHQFSILEVTSGISEQFPAQVFEPFSKLYPGLYTGVGIEMTVCRKIILQHSGEIWAERKGTNQIIHFTISKKLENAPQELEL